MLSVNARLIALQNRCTLLPNDRASCVDLIRLAVFTAHWRRALAAENLFLRKQLALFQERKVKPRRANDSARLRMVILSRMRGWFPGERQSGYVHLLASQRIAAVLALEIQTHGTPPPGKGDSTTNPRNGRGARNASPTNCS